MQPADELGRLPVLARVLVGSRLVRRWVMGQSPGPGREADLRTLDWIDAVVRDGRSGPSDTGLGVAPGLRELAGALDACRVGGAGSGEVSRLVQAMIRAVRDDPWVAPIQVAILMAADIDQIGFACSDLRLNEHDPLTASVFQRLAPVHALTLTKPRLTPEEEAR